VGDKFGHYEVLLLIGKGGWARCIAGATLKLKRDVSLKVWPEAMLA
jgi:hypothetical protein